MWNLAHWFAVATMQKSIFNVLEKFAKVDCARLGTKPTFKKYNFFKFP